MAGASSTGHPEGVLGTEACSTQKLTLKMFERWASWRFHQLMRFVGSSRRAHRVAQDDQAGPVIPIEHNRDQTPRSDATPASALRALSLRQERRKPPLPLPSPPSSG